MLVISGDGLELDYKFKGSLSEKAEHLQTNQIKSNQNRTKQKQTGMSLIACDIIKKGTNVCY